MTSESEEEWFTVRRRRGARSGVSVQKQLKALAIPVVPLAFDALAEPDEGSVQDAAKPKKKKKSKKAKAADAEDDTEEPVRMADKAVSSAAVATTANAGGKAVRTGGGAGVKAKQLSFLAWLWSRLISLLVMVGLMRAPGASKKKRKSKAAAPKATAPPAEDEPSRPAAEPPPPAAKQALEKDVSSKEKPAASVSAVVAAKPAPTPKKQQEQMPAAKVAVAAPATAAAVPTPVKQRANEPAVARDTSAAVASKSAPAAVTASGGAVAAAAAMPLPEATAVPKTPSAAPDKQKAAVPAPPASAPPPAMPPAPPPPAIKYDADWGRGKFVMQSLPTAHADVVAAVALAGDVAVSAGYDGAVKLWHWPPSGSAGGGVAPRLAITRTLVGHSGRVEALAADADSRRLATSGRDSTLKVWDLGTEPGGSGARELASTYVYESVRSLAADWSGQGSAAAGRVLLGARSGTVLLYSLGAGGAGRKVAVLRGHEDEVTALRFLYGSNGGGGGGGGGGQVAVSGSRDGTVRLWDLRTAGGSAAVVLTGLSGRVCSLGPLGEHHLVAGDCSSTVKMWDLRQLPPSSPSKAPPPPPSRLPNAPGFAGDVCPTAGLWQGPRSGVLLSSCIAWWTDNKQALEEAPPSAKLPMACLNVAAVGSPAGAISDDAELQCLYQYTLRLGLGVVTCLTGSADEGGVLAGAASGALWALRLVRGGSAAAAAAERATAAAAAVDSGDGGGGGGGFCKVVDALVIGAEEFSDDEYDDGEDEEEEEN